MPKPSSVTRGSRECWRKIQNPSPWREAENRAQGGEEHDIFYPSPTPGRAKFSKETEFLTVTGWDISTLAIFTIGRELFPKIRDSEGNIFVGEPRSIVSWVATCLELNWTN